VGSSSRLIEPRDAAGLVSRAVERLQEQRGMKQLVEVDTASGHVTAYSSRAIVAGPMHVHSTKSSSMQAMTVPCSVHLAMLCVMPCVTIRVRYAMLSAALHHMTFADAILLWVAVVMLQPVNVQP
jgi:hypothetical protein